jgi:zinc/manganese transport system permease protein
MEFIQIMALPFLACLVLTGIHAYLGLHVIERQVIFVDLALAQIAVLGSGFALLLGYSLESISAYWFSLSFAVIGAAVFSLTRLKDQKIPHEAIIGIVYVVSASLLLIVLSFTGEGTEHIRQSLVGNILLITPQELIKMTVLYSVVGIIFFIFKDQFNVLSRDPAKAFKKGMNMRGWDFLFYVLFGIVVTSSVKIAGVLLVFSFLVIPAVCALILSGHFQTRLILGWTIGTLGSVVGMAASYYFDLPTGASVVCVFGLLLILVALGRR